MTKSFSQTNPEIEKYLLDLLKPEDEILSEIRHRSKAMGLPEIQIAPTDVLHLELIAKSLNAKKIVEIGTLGGYSGVVLARALPEDGKLFTCELNATHAKVASESFKKAGLAHKVEVKAGPALENLKDLEAQGPFDLVFIDADKSNYKNYFLWAAKNLRVGGAVLADNTFAWGLVHQDLPDDHQKQKFVKALREYNQMVVDHKSFRTTIIPTESGLTFSLKVQA